MSKRVDAHQHFWNYSPEEYCWIDESMSVLQRNFMPPDLALELRTAKVDGTIAVQARQSIAETDWLLELARSTSWVKGVVGWLPIAAPNFTAELERYHNESLLKGLRHVVQAEAEGFLETSAFNDGIKVLSGTGHTFDLLIRWHQLPEAVKFVDRHPHQIFVLDHLGKPDIRNCEFAIWAEYLHELAHRDNVVAKLSGLVTEAEPSQWMPETFEPYLDLALYAFGAQRLMLGTDWPVLTQGCTYSGWWKLIDDWARRLSESEKASISGELAARIYRLSTDKEETERTQL